MGMSKGEKMEAGSFGDSEREFEAGKWVKLEQGNNEGARIAVDANFMGNLINFKWVFLQPRGTSIMISLKHKMTKNGISC